MPPTAELGGQLAPGPNPEAPMVATARLTADEPVTVTATIAPDGGEAWTVTFPGPAADTHDLIVLGLLPEVTHALTFEARDRAGNTTALDPVIYTPPALNLPLTVVEPVLRDPEAPTGAWLFAPWGQDRTFVQLRDDDGVLRWLYVLEDGFAADVQLTEDEHVVIETSRQLVEVDLAGNVIRRLVPSGVGGGSGDITVEAPSFHHGFVLLDDGVLVMTNESRLVDEFPTDVLDQTQVAPAEVVGDRILEVGYDGRIRDAWSTLDLLDTGRVRWDGLSQSVGYGVTGYDWSHANGLWADGNDGIVVSSRHQDAVFEIDRDTGTVRWILGTHDGWGLRWQDKLLRPIGDLEWPRHQHSPQVVRRDGDLVTLLLFDNGNHRPPAGTPEDQELAAEPDEYSRIVEYRIDESAMTVEQTWVYDRDDEDFFTDCCSSALADRDGRVFVGDQAGRVFELTRTEPPAKVLELTYRAANGQPEVGGHAERAMRVPDVTRGETW